MGRRKLYILLAVLAFSVVVVIIGLRFFREPAIEPEYTGWTDVSKPSGHLEYILAIGETLHGKLVVDTGNVVFVVTDYWNHHIHDVVVGAGDEYSFSITAKQTGERYRCYFGFLEAEASLPRSARFYHNMAPSGWK